MKGLSEARSEPDEEKEGYGDEKKFLRAILENDENAIKDGKLVAEASHQGFSSFTPDLLFDQLTKDYATAAQIHGERLLRLLTGYEPSFIKRNINIPEFRRELWQSIEKRNIEFKQRGILDQDNAIDPSALKFGAWMMYVEELSRIRPEGFMGERLHKKKYLYGEPEDVRQYARGDRFRDMAVARSIRIAIRRGRTHLGRDDLRIWERARKGSVYVVYALDASGSMRGPKIEMAKKAGIGLAFKALQNKDKVGLVVFGKEVKQCVEPTLDFQDLLFAIAGVKPSRETNIVGSLRKSISLFPAKSITKHVVLLTDAIPNIGKDPQRETLEVVSLARAQGISVSVIGLGLDAQGRKFALEITKLGEGRFYEAKNGEVLDSIVLEDYDMARVV